MGQESLPTVEGTYYWGLVLHLHASNPPPMPAKHLCLYERGEHRVVKLNELYEKSIAERSVLPSTPPAMTITLEKRLNSSTRRIPHVWTAHVQGNTSQNGAMTKTAETAYPPMLVAKIFDPVVETTVST
ncbi:hypothetical protein AGABI1DRAFT_130732 [Agaricus bisporus var. burnettii JB137-S8]|uniref:Uncharacterized protein n=1 Tax=Agaricus bisporus var. burnettii (strain JB137-S8 / ATCC MYA-4627 / FGSC 10392) TaxID=597362 RepID=K5VRB1_AGABU|nr:uncharacterized protein AGABI1DRAFT_130732 [Agaricus bisporus var. burnettii JB137-S8]EKM77004.1 hypothetical protein AGABI1DRAFT_130732 [Agaricus bisporus var. burnettii JB137-S8]